MMDVDEIKTEINDLDNDGIDEIISYAENLLETRENDIGE